MKCAFCGSDTSEYMKRGNMVIVAHVICAAERMDELETDDLVKCLMYDEIKIYQPIRLNK